MTSAYTARIGLRESSRWEWTVVFWLRVFRWLPVLLMG